MNSSRSYDYAMREFVAGCNFLEPSDNGMALSGTVEHVDKANGVSSESELRMHSRGQESQSGLFDTKFHCIQEAVDSADICAEIRRCPSPTGLTCARPFRPLLALSLVRNEFVWV